MQATASNPHGITFDYWGYHYATDGTGGRAYQVVPHGKAWKMRSLLGKEYARFPLVKSSPVTTFLIPCRGISNL